MKIFSIIKMLQRVYFRVKYCSHGAKRCKDKLEYIAQRLNITIDIEELKYRKLNYSETTWGEDEYVSISFIGTEDEFLHIKDKLNAYSPDEYLKLKKSEDFDYVDDFIWMLACYLNEDEDNHIKTTENIHQQCVDFINTAIRYSNYGISEDEERLAFQKGSDVNSSAIVWMNDNRICYYHFAY